MKRKRWFDQLGSTMHQMLGGEMYIIGTIVGSVFAIWLIYGLFERFIFSRFFDDPVKGKLTSVAAAWLFTSILGGFGFANSGPFYWSAFLTHLPAAMLFGFLGYRRGLVLRAEFTDHSDTAEIFR